ncbi:MAG: DUF6288 domain-containing protein [Haloferula sp.]
MRTTVITLASLAATALSCFGADSFYTGPAVFSTRPGETKSLQTMDRFGPVGMGLELIQPAFTMRIKNIEEGSPAAATGKLEKGQIIESINGQALKDIDPRIQLAGMIEKAEATDGKLSFKIKDVAEPVVVELPVLGAYSESWPLDCPKSDKIVRGLADYIGSPEGNKGIGDIGMIFLLSTGDEKDLAVVRDWARKTKPHTYAWYQGFSGIPLCEYYLRTGDKEVLPTIQEAVEKAVAGQYNDGWAGRGGVPSVTYGMGHLNAAGTAVVTFLMLAKECGADVPDHALLGALRHFYRYSGRGGNPYGDGRPECGFVDNGKNGNLAFAMAAAAALTPDGEDSVYAAARDVNAKTSFYTTSFMLHGHTGGGIGEIWRGASMGLMMDKKPVKHREFMDNRQWFYDISRRHDGSFGIVGGGNRYDKELWGTGMALSYTIPRKKLRMAGAPPTKFSKTYQLPKRPWGTARDEEFYRLDPIPGTALTPESVDSEELAIHGSWPVYRVVMDPGVSDDTLLEYAHHPDHGIRRYSVDAIFKHKRDHLILQLLESDDVRARHAGTIAIYGTFKRRPMGADRLTDEMIKLLGEMIHDPEESWWIVYNAIMALNACEAKVIEPHIDRLVHWLEHEEWWLSMAAMTVLNKVVTDPEHYQRLMPIFGRKIQENRRAVPLAPLRGYTSQLARAKPEIQKFGTEILERAYANFPTNYTAPGGVDMYTAADFFQRELNSALSSAPGGMEALQRIPKRTSAWQKSRKDTDKFIYDGTFKDQPSLHGTWTVIDFVGTPDEFTSGKKMNPGKPSFPTIEFKGAGKTNTPSLIWSDKNLIDLSKNQMLIMDSRTIDGQTYLLVEAGGFTSGQPTDWHPGWFVMKK